MYTVINMGTDKVTATDNTDRRETQRNDTSGDKDTDTRQR